MGELGGGDDRGRFVGEQPPGYIRDEFLPLLWVEL